MSTTMTYDAGSRGSVPSVTTMLAYDNSSNQIRCLDVHAVVTTCTYVDRRNCGLPDEPNATGRHKFAGGRLRLD